MATTTLKVFRVEKLGPGMPSQVKFILCITWPIATDKGRRKCKGWRESQMVHTS